MNKKCNFLFLLFFLFSLKITASHIVGGELYYDCLGGDNYKITLKLYRDCYNGQAPYDSVAYLSVFDASGGFVDTISILFPGSVVLPATINNPCFTPPGDICVEEAIYTAVIHLPSIPGGYDIAYQRCCRNMTILNIVDPFNTGATYTTHIPEAIGGLCNSSPHYINFPPIFICSGIPLVFDHSAVDADGDSLYYELCDPFTCPPDPLPILDPPPYSNVVFTSSYSGSYPMSSSPALAIDPHTGLMTGTPNQIGQWVVAVCVSEYRNGNLLDISKRDFQFNVIDCPGLPVAIIEPQTTFCTGYEVDFQQGSLSANSFEWQFGDPSTISDVSGDIAPVWTYPDSGTYQVTLIINPGTPCADSTTETFHLQHLLAPTFDPGPGECFTNNSFDFTAAGDFAGNGTFNWDFGTDASLPSASVQNVNGVSFDTVGVFPVTLTIAENGCTNQYTANVNVSEKPVADYSLLSDTVCNLQPVYFTDASQGSNRPFGYQWSFGDGNVSSEQNPYHVYDSTGTYFSSLILTNALGCTDTFSLAAGITIVPTPVAGFSVTPTDTSVLYATIGMTDQSTGGSGCFVNWGDGTVSASCDTVHQYVHPGTYTIMQVVENASGCTDTAYSTVLVRAEFVFWIPNAFTPYQPNGLNDVFKPKVMGVHEYSFIIYDRWGEKLFETTDTEAGWDGTFKGKRCSNDVYVYLVSFLDDVRNDAHEYAGHVVIVR